MSFAIVSRAVSEKDEDKADPQRVHDTRRQVGGARREASERVLLRAPGFEATGWTLNLSRGGVRIVVEDAIEQGAEYDVLFGDEEAPSRRGRVVWLQQEADGQIAGLQFLLADGTPMGGTPPPERPPEG